jgi:hypothetical protein
MRRKERKGRKKEEELKKVQTQNKSLKEINKQ